MVLFGAYWAYFMRIFNLLILLLLFILPTLLFAGVIPQPQFSQNKLQKIVDLHLEQYHDGEHISGITVTLDKNNNTTLYSGNTDFFNQHPINSSHLYQIGSITKSFIAAVILQLEATPELHFSIEDKLSIYLPQYAEWGDITIKQLLNMTSGIPDYLEDDSYLRDLANNPDKNWQPDEELSYVAKKPLLFSPGIKWYYSNSNYILIGLVIKKLTARHLRKKLINVSLPRKIYPNFIYRIHIT